MNEMIHHVRILKRNRREAEQSTQRFNTECGLLFAVFAILCDFASKKLPFARPIHAFPSLDPIRHNEDMTSVTTSSELDASASGGSIDEPIDAIVLDVHPAFLPRDYPYGPKAASLPRPTSDPFTLFSDLGGVVAWLARASDHYLAAVNSPPDFVVPKTFGMSAILGIMTALAFVFACLRWLDAWPVFYFFFAALALVICMAQMFYGKTPRLASIVAGAIVLPVFSLGAALFDDNPNPAIVCLIVGFVPFGAFMGYLTGTCAAGVFLVMDYLEPYLQGRGVIRHDQPSPG